MHPRFFGMLCLKVKIIITPENSRAAIAECVLQKIKGACVHTRTRGIEATFVSSVLTGDDPVYIRKPWQWPVNEAIVILCVHVDEHTQ